MHSGSTDFNISLWRGEIRHWMAFHASEDSLLRSCCFLPSQLIEAYKISIVQTWSISQGTPGQGKSQTLIHWTDTWVPKYAQGGKVTQDCAIWAGSVQGSPVEVLIPSVEVKTLRGEVTCLEACNTLVAELEIKLRNMNMLDHATISRCYCFQVLIKELSLHKKHLWFAVKLIKLNSLAYWRGGICFLNLPKMIIYSFFFFFPSLPQPL